MLLSSLVQNLQRNIAANEEDALNLLFLGDTNRTIAETPMNMASSRCIPAIRPQDPDWWCGSQFTLHIHTVH